MKRSVMLSVCVTLMLVAASAAAGGVEVGEKAPGFTLEDHNGNKVSLSDFEGKVVVLEWTNPDCPFVKRHYAAGTMKQLAATYGAKDVVWLTINSTHYMDAKANREFATAGKLEVPILIDADGRVGKLFGARTTPHMFVIGADGEVVYNGAVDDDPRGGKGDGATNYVAAALDDTLAGKSVATAETKPYGCSVKYKS